MTFLQMTTTLKKGNTIIARRIYSVRKIQPLFKSDVYRFSLIYGHVDQQRFVLSRNQAEALSSCTKQCIENIVKDINTSLEK